MGLQPSTHRKKVAHPVRWNPLFSLDKNTVALGQGGGILPLF